MQQNTGKLIINKKNVVILTNVERIDKDSDIEKLTERTRMENTE